ncbi:MAG TPA: hypothetical protein VK078_09615 [Pseudogracilibacillus sp.]|nr:hypothetical protein [Pseudogracilibacillus sp.]
MHELVGYCENCHKAIYCENGFFNGVVLPGHHYLCFECEGKQSKEDAEQQIKE